MKQPLQEQVKGKFMYPVLLRSNISLLYFYLNLLNFKFNGIFFNQNADKVVP